MLATAYLEWQASGGPIEEPSEPMQVDGLSWDIEVMSFTGEFDSNAQYLLID